MNLDLHYAMLSSMITNEFVTSALPHAPVHPEPTPPARRRVAARRTGRRVRKRRPARRSWMDWAVRAAQAIQDR
jgi:hypothetical protein